MAKTVETEYKNWKGEGTKPETIGNYTTLIQGVERKGQKLHYYHDAKYQEIDKRLCVIFATDGSLNKFHIVHKIHHNQKSKGQELCFQGLHTWQWSDKTHPAQSENKNDSTCTISQKPQHLYYQHHQHANDHQ